MDSEPKVLSLQALGTTHTTNGAVTVRSTLPVLTSTRRGLRLHDRCACQQVPLTLEHTRLSTPSPSQDRLHASGRAHTGTICQWHHHDSDIITASGTDLCGTGSATSSRHHWHWPGPLRNRLRAATSTAWPAFKFCSESTTTQQSNSSQPSRSPYGYGSSRCPRIAGCIEQASNSESLF